MFATDASARRGTPPVYPIFRTPRGIEVNPERARVGSPDGRKVALAYRVFTMQFSSPKFSSILVAAGVAAIATTAKAQTYEFHDNVDQSNSSEFAVGQSIEIKYQLQQPRTNELPGFPGFLFYVVDWASVKINNVEYMPVGQTPIAPTFYDYTSSTISNGLVSYSSDNFDHNLQTLSFVFSSSTEQVHDEDGVLEGGISIG